MCVVPAAMLRAERKEARFLAQAQSFLTFGGVTHTVDLAAWGREISDLSYLNRLVCARAEWLTREEPRALELLPPIVAYAQEKVD